MASPSEQDEGLGGRNMTMERVLEELSVTFFFVSEFMRRVSNVQYTSFDIIVFPVKQHLFVYVCTHELTDSVSESCAGSA